MDYTISDVYLALAWQFITHDEAKGLAREIFELDPSDEDKKCSDENEKRRLEA
jgi:hypothetical protein